MSIVNESNWVALPVVTTLLSTLAAVVSAKAARQKLNEFEFGASAITAYVITLNASAMFFGAWADLVPPNVIVSGRLTLADATWISIVAFAFCLFVFLNWLFISKQVADRKTAEEFEFLKTELGCQVRYLCNVLNFFRGCIGKYEEELDECLKHSSDDDVLPLPNPQKLRRLLLEAARSSFLTLPTVPPDSLTTIALFAKEGNSLVPVESTDGDRWGWIDRMYPKWKHSFDLGTTDASIAVESVHKSVTMIIPNCAKAHQDSTSSFKFFSDEASQRAKLGSLIAIPFAVNERGVERPFVMCIACDKSEAFLETHDWKVKQIQKEVEVRYRLLTLQQEFVDLVESYTLRISTELHQLKSSNASAVSKIDVAATQVENVLTKIKKLEAQLVESRGYAETARRNELIALSVSDGLKLELDRLSNNANQLRRDISAKKQVAVTQEEEIARLSALRNDLQRKLTRSDKCQQEMRDELESLTDQLSSIERPLEALEQPVLPEKKLLPTKRSPKKKRPSAKRTKAATKKAATKKVVTPKRSDTDTVAKNVRDSVGTDQDEL